MSDQLTLAAETRDRVGKGASRALRRQGRVPAVIYGQNRDASPVHVEEKALTRALATGHFMTTVVTIGGQRTLPKDVAFDPVTDRPVHVDFLRIGEHSTVTVAVPVVFTGVEDAPFTKAGGVLNIVRHELELVVDAADIPAEITVSVAGANSGDSIHISQVQLPAGATSAIEDRDFTIATIATPSGVLAEAAGETLEGADNIETVEAMAGEQADTDDTGAGGEGRSE